MKRSNGRAGTGITIPQRTSRRNRTNDISASTYNAAGRRKISDSHAFLTMIARYSPQPRVLVVGAGRAGSVAAHTLARAGVDVRLLDRAVFPRNKPCGGGISLRVLTR